MNHRIVLMAISGAVLLGSTAVNAASAPITAPLRPDSNAVVLVQPESKEEHAERLRETQVQNRAAAEREVETIAAEMRLDRPTQEKLIDITIEGSIASVDLMDSHPDFRDHGLAFARLLADRYDNKLARIRSLLGEHRLRRYQWCIENLAALREVQHLEARLGAQDSLTLDQRTRLIHLLTRVNTEEQDALAEALATPSGLSDANGDAATYVFQPQPERAAAHRAKVQQQSSSLLSARQLQSLLAEEDEKATSADSVRFLTDMSQIPGEKIFDLPIEPRQDTGHACAFELAVQLDDAEPVVTSHAAALMSRLDVPLPKRLIARMRIYPGSSSGPRADADIYEQTDGELRRLNTMGTFGSMRGDATIMVQVIAGRDQAHILLTSIRPLR